LGGSTAEADLRRLEIAQMEREGLRAGEGRSAQRANRDGRSAEDRNRGKMSGRKANSSKMRNRRGKNPSSRNSSRKLFTEQLKTEVAEKECESLEEVHKEQDDRGMRFFEIASDLADDVIKTADILLEIKKGHRFRQEELDREQAQHRQQLEQGPRQAADRNGATIRAETAGEVGPSGARSSGESPAFRHGRAVPLSAACRANEASLR
jgi:hypothetical protein